MFERVRGSHLVEGEGEGGRKMGSDQEMVIG